MISPSVSESDAHSDAAHRMNRMYRWQRHLYDVTRRYFLLGRDQLIVGLRPPADARVLEIGCGTGRNLVVAAGQYRQAQFFGIDASLEMLASAAAAIERHGLSGRIRVAQGDALTFDARALFGVPRFDHVMISYTLSMIREWPSVLEHAVSCLAPGGRLHVVDFGDQRHLPKICRPPLLRWLAWFEVTPRDQLELVLTQMAERAGAALTFARPFGGYAQYAVLALPPAPRAP